MMEGRMERTEDSRRVGGRAEARAGGSWELHRGTACIWVFLPVLALAWLASVSEGPCLSQSLQPCPGAMPSHPAMATEVSLGYH